MAMIEPRGRIVPVLLSGGAGSRLWPLSRETYPKQLLSLLGENTLLQQTALRVDDRSLFAEPMVIANAEHRFAIGEQLRAVGVDRPTIVLEPFGRNTAPAVAVAALLASESDPDAVILAMPVDHWVRDHAAFRAAISTGVTAARYGRFVLFGVRPSSAATGFGYIRSEKIVLGAISLDLFAVLLSGASALLPVYARDILQLGPWGLGLLRAAPSVGAICVAVWLASHPIRNHAGMVMLGSAAAFGACTVLFGLSTLTWLSIAALALLGATDMFSVYIRETLIQLWTPDHVRGRVNAVNQVFVGASNELGEFRAGTMAALIGTVPAVVIGALASRARSGSKRTGPGCSPRCGRCGT